MSQTDESPKTLTVRIEFEYPVEGMDFDMAGEAAEFILSPVLATLDTLGLTAKEAELWNNEDGQFKNICKDEVEWLNSPDPGDEDDDDEDD